MLLAASLLLLLLRCPAGSPAAPAAPQRLRFQAHTFQHLLLWEPPDCRAAPRLLYDVQWKRYGNHSWTPVAGCTAIARRSCDLTAQTAEPSSRYFARVRALAPDGASDWALARPFSPKEATLQLWGVSLSLSGNVLRVTVELPAHSGQEATLSPGGWAQYRVYVRSTAGDAEYRWMATNRTFELPALLWGERYCVSVEPHLPSRPNPARRTEERCVSLPPRTDSPGGTAGLSSVLFSLVALGLIAGARARAYVKKPAEPPAVLASFRKQTAARPVGRSGPRDLRLEVVSVQEISAAGLRDPSRPAPAAAGCGPSDAPSSGGAGSPRLGDLAGGSGCSADSGVCLREPPGSPGFLPPAGPLGGGGLWPGSSPEEEGRPGGDEGLLQPGGLDSDEALRQAGPLHQLRAGGPGEALASPLCPARFEGTAQAKPLPASGYLKQASVAVASAPGAPEAGLGSSLGGGSTPPGPAPSSPSMGAGGPESWPGLPEFPKAPLAPAPLALLCSNARLSLDLPWCRG